MNKEQFIKRVEKITGAEHMLNELVPHLIFLKNEDLQKYLFIFDDGLYYSVEDKFFYDSYEGGNVMGLTPVPIPFEWLEPLSKATKEYYE